MSKKITVPHIDIQKKEFIKVLFQHEDVHFLSYKTNNRLFSLPIKYFDEELRFYIQRPYPLFAAVSIPLIHDVVNLTELQLFRWADLHRHSGYSFLDGGTNISDMVKKTDFVGAITDHGNMHGVLNYYNNMTKQGKLPIIGMEAYAETIDGEKKGNHLLLLAKNRKGFNNLAKLTSLSYENIYRKPHISYEMLEKHREGLIATTTCMSSEIARNILNGNLQQADYVTKQMIEFFGDDFYVEIQRHRIEEELVLNAQLERIAKKHNLKMIATTDSHYLNRCDKKTHEILLCMETKKTIDDPTRLKFDGQGYHLHSEEEMFELFSDMPHVLSNTIEIAHKCKELNLDKSDIFLPHFAIPDSFKDEMEYLHHTAKEGFKKRFEGFEAYTDKKYIERLDFELSVIKNMGFPGYFLIVADLIQFAKSQGILVGPGRGSAAGSLVAYCLGITDLDPIPFDLLFERFLNPDRVSMPDIDFDIQDDRRDELIQYTKDKYGEKSVSKIVTINTLGAKSSLISVAKTFSYSTAEYRRITKTVPNKVGISLREAYEESVDFVETINSSDTSKEIYEHAIKLENLPKNVSQHACAVVIADGRVDDYVPTLLMKKDKHSEEELVSQFDKKEVEQMGLLKIDFLGLRTLRAISNALEMVNERRKEEGLQVITYDDIPIDDPKIYQEIATGETVGVFQLESMGMRDFMKDLFHDAYKFKEPSLELFERLIAGVSLYRPGPMDHIPTYLENMNNPSNIKYELPLLEPILKSTHNVIIYQEQTSATRFV